MTTLATACPPPVTSSTATPAAVTLVGGLFLLYIIVVKAQAVTSVRARRLGGAMVAGSGLSLAAALLLQPAVHRHGCGSLNAAGTVQVDLIVLTMVLFMLGTAWRTGSEWIAMASAVVLDISLFWWLLGLRIAHRGIDIDVLIVHAMCTSVASYWSRAVRAAPRHLRAKASEAGRVLASGWVIVVAIGFAGFGEPQGADTFLTNSTWLSLFIGGAVAAVLGTGYTKYAEVRTELAQVHAAPADLLTVTATLLRTILCDVRDWHRRYQPWF